MALDDDDSNGDNDEKGGGANDEDDLNVEFIGFSWDQETNIIKKLGGRSDVVNLI